MMVNQCVVCGYNIPEGNQVCNFCIAPKKKKVAPEEQDVRQTIANNMSRIMESAKQTRWGLARATGIRVETINNWYSAKNVPSSDLLYLISHVLNVPMEAFLEGVPVVKPKPTIAENLRRLMSEHDITVPMLAEFSRVSQGTINTWLQIGCKVSRNSKAIQRVADVLRVTVEELRGEQG